MLHRTITAAIAAIVLITMADRASAQATEPVTGQTTVPAMAPPAASTDTKAAPQTGGYPAVPLLSTSKTIVGETIRYPRSGPAQVTAAIFTLEPGGKSMLHKHGVPLFAYILDGELTVNYGKHGTRVYKKGDSLVEAMDVAHFSVNNGDQPVRLLAVYMGAKRAKDVIPVK